MLACVPRVPQDCAAARPSALTIALRSSPSTRPTAAAAPMLPGDAGDVPAAARSGAGRDDHAAQPAFDLHADHQRGEEVFAADRLLLGEREQRRDHRSGRMRDGRQMRVVVGVRGRGEAVDHRGAGRIEALAPADHAAASGRGIALQALDRRRDRRRRRAAERAADPVHHRAHAFALHVRREARERAG